MIKIAIVDDEMIDLITAENFLRQHLAAHYPQDVGNIQIDTFSRGMDLISAYETGLYDLVLLDICMEGLDGLQAAEVIRSRDQNVSIIFLTSSEEHPLDGYRVYADGYFLKPLADHRAEFEKTFSYVFPKLTARYKELKVSMDGLEFSIPLRNIRYLNINRQHQVCVHLLDRDLVVSNSYEECRTVLLNDERFLECYHRVLVNMDLIISMTRDYFVLTNAERVPISQRRQKAARTKYMHYLVHR